MMPLTLPAVLVSIVHNPSYAAQVQSLRTTTSEIDVWTKWAGRTVKFSHENVDRETGEIVRVYCVQLVWGRGVYDVRVTEDTLIALSRNLCAVTSRSAGRLTRSCFAIRVGGR